MLKRRLLLVFINFSLLLGACSFAEPPPQTFDGERAFELVEAQVALGPRLPGTPGHTEFLEWVRPVFEDAGWSVQLHETSLYGYPITNVIASRETVPPDGEWIILAAHYDTRQFADRDPIPMNRSMPVPGANDGASGVAVLLEIARVLPDLDNKTVWLVLFDQEDGGDINGQPWILGSTAFVNDLPALQPGRSPDQVVVVDMIGDAELNIHIELNSTPALVEEIWGSAAALGYDDRVIPNRKYSIIDDHRPFLAAGIPAALMIDFDYEYWHTIKDTPDKVSADSLQAVGSTLIYWLISPEP